MVPGFQPAFRPRSSPWLLGPGWCASSALGSAPGSPPVSARRRRVASRLAHLVLPGFGTHEVLAALAGSVPQGGFRALVPQCEWDLSSRLDMKQFWGTREALCTPARRPTGILSSWSPVTAFAPAAYPDYFWRSPGCILSFVLEAVCWGHCRVQNRALGLWGRRFLWRKLETLGGLPYSKNQPEELTKNCDAHNCQRPWSFKTIPVGVLLCLRSLLSSSLCLQ